MLAKLCHLGCACGGEPWNGRSKTAVKFFFLFGVGKILENGACTCMCVLLSSCGGVLDNTGSVVCRVFMCFRDISCVAQVERHKTIRKAHPDRRLHYDLSGVISSSLLLQSMIPFRRFLILLLIREPPVFNSPPPPPPKKNV